VRKNPAGKRELSRGPDSNERVLNPISGKKFPKSIEDQPQKTQKAQKNAYFRNVFISTFCFDPSALFSVLYVIFVVNSFPLS
jgi:hypothetical protein